MGNIVNSNNAFYSSSAKFTVNPDSKYYDSYTYNTNETTHARGKLGDATKETLKTIGNKTGGWYDNYSYFPYSTYSWFLRGGSFGNGSNAGVFAFNDNIGGAINVYSTRAVLVHTNN